jgi:glycosyltransferase involved in cell wall biosynthesis
MPVLEAMAAGVPTACSDIAPLREVAGDAALRFDPLDDAAISESLLRLVSDSAERARLSAAGRERAGRFSWRRAATATLAALEACAGGQAVPPSND